MSCNGCRVLRKGCSENCILRPCLQWIESGTAQGYATVFVAKFFGRAGLMSFLSAVPVNQRHAVFQSLLYEAAGRTVNPVNGAVGLLSTGNWHVCQAAVETVLQGGTLRPISEFVGGPPELDDALECTDMFKLQDPSLKSRVKVQNRSRLADELGNLMQLTDLDLCLTTGFQNKKSSPLPEKLRLGSPSMNSEESVTTTCGDQTPSDDAEEYVKKQTQKSNTCKGSQYVAGRLVLAYARKTFGLSRVFKVQIQLRLQASSRSKTPRFDISVALRFGELQTWTSRVLPQIRFAANASK
ncbi:LOB domain-containing protein 37-like [Forsythia ovata]|uniref:LOB domain-containing protein 37-like n=1 Tax=Forsythia ovata TaxID=205694 RepID=A0ABD1UTG9_9LAMI